jgi:hypothetical protein
MLEQGTVDYLCALHETRLVPRNTTYPPVDLLSSRQATQSASEKALTSIELFLVILCPSLVQPFRYSSILLTVE